MKAWLGAIGRACVEFLLIAAIIAIVGVLTESFKPGFEFSADLADSIIRSTLPLFPIAILVTLFFSFFRMDRRISSRAIGLLGEFCIGAILFAFVLTLGLLGFAGSGIETARSAGAASRHAAVPPRAGLAAERGGTLVWVRALEGTKAYDAFAADFSRPFPRLAYSPSADFDPRAGTLRIQDRRYPADSELEPPSALVPEAEALSGYWLWDRLSRSTERPLLEAVAAALGFLLLALGARIFARLSGWPLANAFLAAAGLAGVVLADAALSTPFVSGLARQAAPFIPFALLHPAVEAAIGIVLCAVDLAAAPRGRIADA